MYLIGHQQNTFADKITTSFVVETLQEKYLKFVEKMVSRTKPDMDLRQIHIPLKVINQIVCIIYSLD